MVWDILVMAGCILQYCRRDHTCQELPVMRNGLSGLIIPRTDGSNPNPEDAAFVASQRVWVSLGSGLLLSGGIIQLTSYWARWVSG